MILCWQNKTQKNFAAAAMHRKGKKIKSIEKIVKMFAARVLSLLSYMKLLIC